MKWDLGSVAQVGTPEQVMGLFQEEPGAIFPFSLGACTAIVLNESCDLGVLPNIYWPVKVTAVTTVSFTFTVQNGSQGDPPGSTIQFSITQSGHEVYLEQTAHWVQRNPWDFVFTNATEPGAAFQ